MAYSLELLEHIYEQCLDMPEEKRAEFIVASCGNNREMEAMLLRMLNHNQQAIEYFEQLQQTLARGLSEGSLPRLETGEIVGKYRIVRFLAKGGMSNVYIAERDDGHFEQQVVVKCLPSKALMHEDALHQADEHKILARLRHPNIATLYDVGITTGNVPYFIMEFIEGIPIDEYVEQKKLSIDRRLALFGQVLEAVAYAHSHLILHLDLKPANILVNEAGHVKLLDFGIATAITSTHQGKHGFVGTPKIAAPEQFSGEALSVSTDVYQMGMLLHKLIAGNFPETDTSPKLEEKKVRERIQQAAENRKIEGNVDYELAAILRKCLHTDPVSRYSGAGNLLDDVRNYREHLPVGAMDQNLKYRLAKFTQRQRTASVAFVLILLALLAGTTVSLWQASEARQQRDLALKNEQVSTATKNFLLDLFMAAHPSVNMGDTMTVFQFLDKGYEKAETYTGSAQIKLEMLTTMGKLYRSLGDFTKSGVALNKAFKLAQDSSLQLSVNYIQAVQQLALYQRDKGNYDSAAVLMNQVMKMYGGIHYPEKDSLFTASLKYQSYIFQKLEKADSAIVLIEKAIALEEQIWPKLDNINLAESYHVLGVIYKNRSQPEPAIRYLTKSLKLCQSLMGENFPGTMANHNALMGVLKQSGKTGDALMHSQQALAIAVRLYGLEHRETATTLDNTGLIYTETGLYDSAYRNLKLGQQIRQKIYPGKVNQPLINSGNNLLSLFITANKSDSARKYLSEAFVLAKSDNIHARQRAYTYSLAGDYYKLTAQPDSARYFYQKSIAENLTYLPESDEKIAVVREKLGKIGAGK